MCEEVSTPNRVSGAMHTHTHMVHKRRRRLSRVNRRRTSAAFFAVFGGRRATDSSAQQHTAGRQAGSSKGKEGALLPVSVCS